VETAAEPVDAAGWARAVLGARGAHVHAVEEVHRRAWSTVWRIDTDQGTLFCKTAPPGVSAEPAVLRVLAEHDVPHVQRPVAVSGAHVLLPDGGETVRTAPDRDRAWVDVMRHYAEVQLASAPTVDALVAAGVPDLRLDVLPEVARVAVERWAPERASWLPLLTDRAAELAELVPMATVEHSDLHDGNAFRRGAVPFDWGDACVAHPFLSLLVAGREGVPGAIEAYLDVFFGPDRDPRDAAVQRAVELAAHLATIPRALSWERAVDAAGAAMPEAYRGAARAWLLTIDGSEL
jgi:hypothetical protein